MKKSPRSGAKVETKRRVSTKKRTVRKPKPPKTPQLGQKKGVEETTAEGTVSVDEKTKEALESLNDTALEFKTAKDEPEHQSKSMLDMAEFLRVFGKLSDRPWESDQEKAVYITLLSICGQFIAKMLSIYGKERPDLVGPIAEKCFAWPLLWYPSTAAQKRASDEIAQMNVGKALPFKLETTTRSDAAYTEIALMIHQIVASLREPKQLHDRFGIKGEYTLTFEEITTKYRPFMFLPFIGIPLIPVVQNMFPRTFPGGIQSWTDEARILPIAFYPALLRKTFCQPAVPALELMRRFESRCRSLPLPSKDSSKEWVNVGFDIFEYISGREPEKYEALKLPADSQIPATKKNTSITPEDKLKDQRRAINYYFKRMFRKQLRMQPEDNHD